MPLRVDALAAKQHNPVLPLLKQTKTTRTAEERTGLVR
jgi:hypothetical protein